MVIISPYRPRVGNIIQRQPTQFSAAPGSTSTSGFDGEIITSTPPAGDRQIVLEGDFTQGWHNESHINFITAGDPDGGSKVSTSYGTLNGAGAIFVTFEAGATPVGTTGDWGFESSLPASYDEIWLTFDVKFLSPYSCPKGMKLPGLKDSSSIRIGHRMMLSGDGSDTTGNKPAHCYFFDADGTGPQNKIGWGQVIVLDTVCRIEEYTKFNSAFNVSDGIMEERYNVGTANTHANPVTIRAGRNNVRWYGGSESNRNPAKFDTISWHLFFGGNDNSWAPTIDTTAVFGQWKVEIPA